MASVKHNCSCLILKKCPLPPFTAQLSWWNHSDFIDTMKRFTSEHWTHEIIHQFNDFCYIGNSHANGFDGMKFLQKSIVISCALLSYRYQTFSKPINIETYGIRFSYFPFNLISSIEPFTIYKNAIEFISNKHSSKSEWRTKEKRSQRKCLISVNSIQMYILYLNQTRGNLFSAVDMITYYAVNISIDFLVFEVDSEMASCQKSISIWMTLFALQRGWTRAPLKNQQNAKKYVLCQCILF